MPSLASPALGTSRTVSRIQRRRRFSCSIFAFLNRTLPPFTPVKTVLQRLIQKSVFSQESIGIVAK